MIEQTPTQRERQRIDKHAEGLRLMAEGKDKEARKCFLEVIADARAEA